MCVCACLYYTLFDVTSYLVMLHVLKTLSLSKVHTTFILALACFVAGLFECNI